MKSYIVFTFLVSSVFIACNARVIDPVTLEEEAALAALALGNSDGLSEQLAAIAGVNDQNLSRQQRIYKRDVFKFLAFMQLLQTVSNGFGNGGNNNQGGNNGNGGGGNVAVARAQSGDNNSVAG